MTDKKILNSSIMNFFGKKEECRSLSNFWEKEVVIVDGGERRVYESGEHCFHGEKYKRLGDLCENDDRKNVLNNYSIRFLLNQGIQSGASAKKMGGKKGLALNEGELRIWNEISVGVQREICQYKFNHYEEVRVDLLQSGNKILVHPAMRCSEDKVNERFWEGKGVVRDGEIVILGRNMLGNIWMSFR